MSLFDSLRLRIRQWRGMSSRDPDLDYRSPQHALPFVIEQRLKRVHTCLPGHIVDYREPERRASVRSAIHLKLTDGSIQERPIIPDVPVVFPAGGGYTMRFPLPAGTPVLLLFSMRGMRAFLAMLEPSPPGADGILAERDAIALPGFGPPLDGVTPASTTGMSLQSDDGMRHVTVDEDAIRSSVDGKAVTLTATELMADLGGASLSVTAAGAVTITASAGVTIISPTLTHNGVNVGSTHTHAGVMPGAGSTGPPS